MVIGLVHREGDTQRHKPTQAESDDSRFQIDSLLTPRIIVEGCLVLEDCVAA